MVASEGSVTRWLPPLQAGDPAAIQQLWERFFRRLVGLARKKLRGAPCLVEGAEDVALSAFASFVRHAERGRFPELADRDSLWRLLVTLTVRKAAHLRPGPARQMSSKNQRSALTAKRRGKPGDHTTRRYRSGGGV